MTLWLGVSRGKGRGLVGTNFAFLPVEYRQNRTMKLWFGHHFFASSILPGVFSVSWTVCRLLFFPDQRYVRGSMEWRGREERPLAGPVGEEAAIWRAE